MDLDELLLSEQWGITLYGRTVISIEVKVFCSQWPEGFGVVSHYLGKSEETCGVS